MFSISNFYIACTPDARNCEGILNARASDVVDLSVTGSWLLQCQRIYITLIEPISSMRVRIIRSILIFCRLPINLQQRIGQTAAKRICFTIPGKEYQYEKKPFSGLPGILSYCYGLLQSKMETWLQTAIGPKRRLERMSAGCSWIPKRLYRGRNSFRGTNSD